ncbi:MAG: lactate utilization protein [Deltaproteobacteria bacterium]|nr:lactate utilization protein [Deltaproteobacteria bacterium]
MKRATPEIDRWKKDLWAKQAVKALQKNQFGAAYCPTREEAVKYIQDIVSDGTTVGIGGSMTAVELNLVEKLEEKGANVLNKEMVTPAPLPLDPEQIIPMVRKLFCSDLYIASANAITLNGYVLNVDGVGNRVASITIGPGKVVLIAGVNKIARNVEEAYHRLETIACPKNVKRYNLPNPCAKTGYCMDCKSPTRACRIYHLMKFKPMLTDITVLIVGEKLGY